MMLQWILASLHLVALGIGLGAVLARGRALRRELDQDELRQVFLVDTLWGLAAVLWISTGLLRAFGGFEKGTAYYLHSGAFLIKMVLLGLILALEVRPMTTLIQWRLRLARGELPSTAAAGTIARISFVQAVLVVLMVFAATAMSYGYGEQAW